MLLLCTAVVAPHFPMCLFSHGSNFSGRVYTSGGNKFSGANSQQSAETSEQQCLIYLSAPAHLRRAEALSAFSFSFLALSSQPFAKCTCADVVLG